MTENKNMSSPERPLGVAQKIQRGALALAIEFSAALIPPPDVNAINLLQTQEDNQPNRILVKPEAAQPEIIGIQYPQFEKKKADYVEENFQIGEAIIVTIPPTDEHPKPSSFYAEVIAPLSNQNTAETHLKWFDNGQEKSGLMGNENLAHLIGTEWKVALGDDCSGVVRIDFLYQKKTGKVFPNELNTIPGSLAIYLFEPSGIEPIELIDKMIKLAMKKSQTSKELNYLFTSKLLDQK